MRTSLRVGMLIGGAGSIALSVLQARIGLVVAPCLIIAGILSGFAVAKWLDRASYGRQIEEGARAGLLACGLPGFVALLSLLVAGPRDVASLAASSHFFGLDFSPLVLQLSDLGWAGIDVLALVASVVTGIVWSAALVQLFAWSKTSKAVRAVQHARLTAVATQPAEPLNVPALPAPAVARSAQGALVAIGAPVMANAGVAGTPTAGPASSRRGATGAPTVFPQPSVIRMSPPMAPAPVSQQAVQQAKQPPSPAPAATAQSAQPAAPASPNRPSRGKTSAARRMQTRLNEQMRMALEAWEANENGADPDGMDPEGEMEEPSASGTKRAPKPSTFLNSGDGARPAKRNRKKNQTRDWLC